MNKSNNQGQAVFVIVSQQESQQKPYPYVHVNDDGTVRELRSDERSFLETPFLPSDGGRPAIKSSYQSKNGWGTIRGFCRRSHIPSSLTILPADTSPSHKPDRKALAGLLHQIRELGFQVTENPDGSITLSGDNPEV